MIPSRCCPHCSSIVPELIIWPVAHMGVDYDFTLSSLGEWPNHEKTELQWHLQETNLWTLGPDFHISTSGSIFCRFPHGSCGQCGPAMRHYAGDLEWLRIDQLHGHNPTQQKNQYVYLYWYVLRHTYIHPSMHACIHTCIHTYMHTYIHYIHTYNTYITLHYITLHTFHFITLHYIKLHYITLHYIHAYIYIYMYVCTCI